MHPRVMIHPCISWLTPVLLSVVMLVVPGSSADVVAALQSADLVARAEQAKQAMAASRFEEAVVLYREILEKLPNEPGILMNLGMALSMAGHPQEAIDPLTRALKLRPTLRPAALFLGQSYLDTDRPSEAIAPLRTYLVAEPANLQARQMLASALLMAGRPREAAAEFRRVSQSAPDDPKSWYGLVQSYDALSQEALETLRKTPEAALYEPLLAADALESEGRHEQAFALYKQSLERLPTLRLIHEALARIYMKTGHPDWAAQEAAKAASMPPDCGSSTQQVRRTRSTVSGPKRAVQERGTGAVASIARAECEFRAERYLSTISALGTETQASAQYWRSRAYTELASSAFEKLASLPASQELHELRAELYRNQRRHRESVQELKHALAFAPGDPRLRRELAKSIYFTRDWDAARSLFADLLEADPKDPELQFFYGDVLLQSQQTEAALPHLKAAVEGDPTMPTAHASLGRALVQLERFAEAIPHLEAVVGQDEDGSIHYQLARAYQGTGQSDRAQPLMEKYQALQRASRPPEPTAAAITPP
jgi:predicted Zn-dependent protease